MKLKISMYLGICLFCLSSVTVADEWEDMKTTIKKLQKDIVGLKKQVKTGAPASRSGGVDAKTVKELQRNLRHTQKSFQEMKKNQSDMSKDHMALKKKMAGVGEVSTKKSSDAVEEELPLTISGAVEVELSSTDSDAFTGDSVSDIAASTVLLAIDSHLSKMANGHMVFLYEGDTFDVDEAYITIGNDTTPVVLAAGLITVPFGNFTTNLLSDSLTLELGETGESVIKIDFAKGGFGTAFYLFNGDTDKTGEQNQINSFGLNFGYGYESDSSSLSLGLSYISNIGDTNGLQDAVADNSVTVAKKISGMGLFAGYSIGAFNVLFEYVTAADNFTAGEVDATAKTRKPNAYNLEFGLAIGENGKMIALSFQGTENFTAQPKSRVALAYTMDLYEGTSLGAEYKNEKDYGTGDGGTGKSANVMTLKLAYAF